MLIFLDQRPRLAPLAVILAAAAMLGGAYFFQYVMGLQPCQLCYYQRYAHMAAAALALPGLALAPWIFTALGGLGFVASAGLGAFHVGVEQKWWEGLPGCSAPTLDPNATLEQLRDQLMNTSFVPCDEVAWSLFGVSMAGWNALISILLAVAALAAARHLVRRSA
jgi:disulfide bond formation protein DsbB